MDDLRNFQLERTQSPDPSRHTPNAYDAVATESDWLDEVDDDDMDFEPDAEESEDLEFFDPSEEEDDVDFHGIATHHANVDGGVLSLVSEG